MASRNSPRIVAKCHVSVSFGGDSPVLLDILPTTLVASVKDQVLTARGISPTHRVNYLLGMKNGPLLQVEFFRLQASDAQIAAKIKEKQVVELELFETKSLQGKESLKLKQAAASSNSAPSTSSTSNPPHESPRQNEIPEVASKSTSAPSTQANALFSNAITSPSSSPRNSTHTHVNVNDVQPKATSQSSPAPASSTSPIVSKRPRMASKITKLTAVFGNTKSHSIGNVQISSPSASPSSSTQATKHDTIAHATQPSNGTSSPVASPRVEQQSVKESISTSPAATVPASPITPRQTLPLSPNQHQKQVSSPASTRHTPPSSELPIIFVDHDPAAPTTSPPASPPPSPRVSIIDADEEEVVTEENSIFDPNVFSSLHSGMSPPPGVSSSTQPSNFIGHSHTEDHLEIPKQRNSNHSDSSNGTNDLNGHDSSSDDHLEPLLDISRQSVSLDGDSVIALSLLPPPPTLSRFSVIQLHIGNNRYSNMPVQTNVDTEEDQARFEAIMKFFSAPRTPSSLLLNGDGLSSTSSTVSTTLSTQTSTSSMTSSQDSPNFYPQDQQHGSTHVNMDTSSLSFVEHQVLVQPTATPVEKEIVMSPPSLVTTTYHHTPSPVKSKDGVVGSTKIPIVKRAVPVKLATTAPIGAPLPESILRFRRMSLKIGSYVAETGMRLMDFVASPFSIGRYLRTERVFPVVLLPAGPQWIRADLESSRWLVMCDGTSTPKTVMDAVLRLFSAENYILRICGTTEYLLDNDRPLVEYARLRLAIRDRRRIELLCELRAGPGRCSLAVAKHFDALRAEPVPPPLIDPFFGLETTDRETADVNGLMEQPVTFKIHALEHFSLDHVKEHLDVAESTFSQAKSQFASSGYCSLLEIGFCIELALVFNNEILGAISQTSFDPSMPSSPTLKDSSSSTTSPTLNIPSNTNTNNDAWRRTSWKPSPMWVEQLKFQHTWPQLPREVRLMIRVLFRKTKTSRAIVLGEACVDLFDSLGILTTGKNAVPISSGVTYLEKPSFTTTATVTSVYKSKFLPFLHYEIYETKSGLIMLHERSPLRGLPKRNNATPIEFLIPDKKDEVELSRLLRIHPLYLLNNQEKEFIWRFRYFVHFSSPHSLPLLVKCVDWLNPKNVDEFHRLVMQWDTFDPLVALELLDSSVSDSITRTFAVDCIRAFSDEELVAYMLQLMQALLFEPYHDSALARFLLERSLRNRTQVGNSFYWHLVSLMGDANSQERIRMMKESYMQTAGDEQSGKLASQTRLLHHFRSLSAKASKLDPKAKLALLESELQPDLFSVTSETGETISKSSSGSEIGVINVASSLSNTNATMNSPSSPPLSPTSLRRDHATSVSSSASTAPTSTQPEPSTVQVSSPVVVRTSRPTAWSVARPAGRTMGHTQIGSSGNQQGLSGAQPQPPSITLPISASSSTQKPIEEKQPNQKEQLSSSPPPPSSMIVSSSGFVNPSPLEAFTSSSFAFLNLPLDPSMCTRRIIKSKCKFMVSSAAPMWLVFDNADPLAAPAPTIFKCGDDLRQDILILQFLNLMDSIWQRDGLELHVSTYGCMATGKGEGFIEVVQNATTTGKIQKSFGASGALSKKPLASWLQQQHANDPELHEEAIDNFVSSCAAYCIASYVLGLGDRHGDNIMVTTMGNLFHIDFAHILGNIMMFGAYKRERAPFVLTPEFVFVMGDTKSPRYARFVDLCLKGYNSLRRHTYLLIRLFKMMLSAGLPQFSDLRELSYLYKSLSLGLSEQAAADKFAKLIDESRKTTTTLVNNFFHNLATGVPSSSSSNLTGSQPSRKLTDSSSSRKLTGGSSSSRDLNAKGAPSAKQDTAKSRKIAMK